MSKKIIIRENALRNIVMGILFLAGLSFWGGYSLGASGSPQEEKEVVVVDHPAAASLDDVAWLLEAIPSQPTAPANFLPVVPSSPISPPEPATAAPPPPPPPVPPTVSVSSPVQDEEVRDSTISDSELLTVCRNLPCEVHSEDWEWRGFSSSPKLITEKLSLTESTRAQCERVLSLAAKTSRVAAKKLECFRTRHREAQCAQLHWNLREALPRDAKGQIVIRSAVALNLLADFHRNGVKSPNQISLCIGDIREQYTQFVLAEVQAYQAAYEAAPVRQPVLDDIFCAEQRQQITQLPRLDEFARDQTLSEFSFPPFPARAMTQDVMNKVCLAHDGPTMSAAK